MLQFLFLLFLHKNKLLNLKMQVFMLNLSVFRPKIMAMRIKNNFNQILQ